MRGVVASEMPADFAKEALKAQALTARTYIVKQMMSDEKMKLPEGCNRSGYRIFSSVQK